MFLCFNSGILLLLAIIAVGIRQPVLRSFAQLEQTIMKQRLARISDSFLQQAEKLDSEAKANAFWTEMYHYAQRPQPGFYEKTFDYDGLKTSPLDILGILDRKGKVIHLDWLNRTAHKLEPAPQSVQAALLQNRYLKCCWVEGLAAPQSPRQKFAVIPTSLGPLLIAARPIVTSAADGPPAGTLFMGRLIDRTVLSQLTRHTPSHLSLYWPTSWEKIQALASDSESFTPTPRPYQISPEVRILGNQWLTGSIFLLDGANHITQVMSLTAPRQEYLRGEAMLNQLTLVLFLIGIPLSIMSSLMLDRSLRYQQLLRNSERELKAINQELQRLVNLDSLTQVANRRCLDQYLKQEWTRALREQQPLSLIIFDVDYFKRFNDTYGHLAGDDCLRTIVASVQQTVRRPADLVARYGGEEFAVILPNTDGEGSLHVAQTIQTSVHELGLKHASSPLGIVTVSLGVATTVPSQEKTPETLVELSDKALYLAKQQGRNCIICSVASPC